MAVAKGTAAPADVKVAVAPAAKIAATPAVKKAPSRTPAPWGDGREEREDAPHADAAASRRGGGGGAHWQPAARRCRRTTSS